MSAITQNHKNGCSFSIINDKELQYKLDTVMGHSTTLTCCWPSWISAITQNHKIAVISLKLMIGTCNKIWTQLSLGHSTTSTVVSNCRNWIPMSWFLQHVVSYLVMVAIYRNHKQILLFLFRLIFIFCFLKWFSLPNESPMCNFTMCEYFWIFFLSGWG